MSQSVSRISLNKASVYAFEITGKISADAMEYGQADECSV